MKAICTAIAALAAVGLSAPVQAENWAVSKIRYDNEGSYIAFFDIMTPSAMGKACSTNYRVPQGKSYTITLGVEDYDRGPKDEQGGKKKDCNFEIGREVWARVLVDYGAMSTNLGCRKDKARFYFHPDGGTLKVFTKGTTQNNNRCRIKSKGGVRWDNSKHGRLP